jgi:hypothetical protein
MDGHGWASLFIWWVSLDFVHNVRVAHWTMAHVSCFIFL